MLETASISGDELHGALEHLMQLINGECGMALAVLFAAAGPVRSEEFGGRDSRDAVWRVDRLIGNTIKQPSAMPADRRGGVSETKAG